MDDFSEACEGYIDHRSARDVQEILRRKGFSGAEPFNPRNYLILLGLHDKPVRPIKKNYSTFS